jgi:nitrite reductase (NADH) small subunit
VTQETNKREDEAFTSKRTQDVHAPGEAGAARRKPESENEGDMAARAREREAHEVGDPSDFPMGSHKVVKVGGRQIGIFNIDGNFYGLPNVCPHQTGPLCEGKIVTGTLISNEDTNWETEWIHDGEIMICPWHGLEYHVPTGQCMAFPNIRVRRYEVFVEDGKVKVKV